MAEKYNLNTFVTEVTNIKKPAYLLIDDRCLTFGGDYADMLDKIKNFKVWHS